MMKKTILLVVIAAVLASCTTKPHYVINANISGSDTLIFLLQKREAGKYVTIDSAASKSGHFKMQGVVDYPQMVMLTAKNTRNRAQFFLENAPLTISGKVDSLYNINVTGSKTQDEYKGYINNQKSFSDRYSSLYKEYQSASEAKDTAKQGAAERAINGLETEMTNNQKEFVKNNPSSFFTPMLLSNLSYEMSIEELENSVNALDTNVQKVQIVKDLKDQVKALKLVAIGQKAPDFTMNDPEGKPVTLASKIGSKLLLIDFWASWCGPCRQENPNVVKVYAEYHKKGFDILGVSLDRSKEDWVKAIADDKLTWSHVSDLKYWDNAAAKQYAVRAIPSNILLDETGTIIGRNLRGEDLAKKVTEVLGTKK
jgi:peroxiredoxin